MAKRVTVSTHLEEFPFWTVCSRILLAKKCHISSLLCEFLLEENIRSTTWRKPKTLNELYVNNQNGSENDALKIYRWHSFILPHMSSHWESFSGWAKIWQISLMKEIVCVPRTSSFFYLIIRQWVQSSDLIEKERDFMNFQGSYS